MCLPGFAWLWGFGSVLLKTVQEGQAGVKAPRGSGEDRHGEFHHQLRGGGPSLPSWAHCSSCSQSSKSLGAWPHSASPHASDLMPLPSHLDFLSHHSRAPAHLAGFTQWCRNLHLPTSLPCVLRLCYPGSLNGLGKRTRNSWELWPT